MTTSRREFLQFFSASTLAYLTGCTHNLVPYKSDLAWTPLQPSLDDKLLLAPGLNYSVLAKWQDQIAGTNENPIQFGTHNDFTCFIPFDQKNSNEGYLLVNHEYLNPLFVSGWSDRGGIAKTKAQVDIEMKSVGASLLHIKKENDQWTLVKNSIHNTRFDATTEIPFVSEHSIYNSKVAIGTMANCAGGKTPWNTFLTCEENYDMYYGEWNYRPKVGQKKLRKNPMITFNSKDMGWYNHYDRSPLHYGWVVEINPVTKLSKKLTALGRFAHECATCVVAKDGRTVVYMGDDAIDQCIYKFISDKPGSLESGTLYVANTEQGRWIPLTLSSHPDFKSLYKNQTELLIHTRLAAEYVGGTPQDRPEDIEINPSNGDIIVALTNNKKYQRPHGSLLKITETNGDHLSLTFKSDTWISCGDKNNLSSPDNLAFDKAGNLWITTDRAEEEMKQDHYARFKNNGLFYIPMKGENAGQIYQVASAPADAEFTGPSFSPDGETLFLCVQHPGDQTKEIGKYTSSWPDGPGKMPKSAVVTIQGDLLKKLTS